MCYLTYAEYLAAGRICDQFVFDRMIVRACALIDSYTQSRVSRMAEVPERVKVLCIDLVDFYSNNANYAEKEVASYSESAGAVSESVSYVAKSQQDFELTARTMVFDYLYQVYDDEGTPLLYRGCRN